MSLVRHFLCATLLAAIIAYDKIDAQNLPSYRATETLRLGGANAAEPFAFEDVPRLAVDSTGMIFARLTSQGTVLVLRADGTFLRRIGRLGAGPGEFQLAGTHGILGDTIWVCNWPTPRISLFRRDGTHLTTRPTTYDLGRRFSAPVGISGLLSSDRAYLHQTATPVGVDSRIALPVLVGDGQLNNPDTIALVPSPSGMFVPTVGSFAFNPTPMSPLIAASANGLGIATASWSRENPAVVVLRVLNPSGSERFRREITLTSTTIPNEYRDSLVAIALTKAQPALAAARRADVAVGGRSASVSAGAGRGGMASAPAAPLRQTNEELVTRALDLPARFPPVRRMVLGVDGTIWLEQFGNGQPGNWLILSRSGEAMFRIQLPVSLEVQQASATAVWGTERDSLDVPYIVKMSISTR